MRGRRPGQRHDHRAAVLSSAQTATVAGRELSFPVEVRAARSWAANYLVDRQAAQRLIDQTGLRIAPVLGRALLSLVFVDYVDTDLDAYHEVGVAFLVKGPSGRGVYIHHLPVDQNFTLAAGRELWGYPKFRAEISLTERGRKTTCSLRHDGADVLELTVRTGWLPAPQPALPTYTHLDGALRVTRWKTQGWARQALGRATVRLGSHPIADELRSVGLPKHAFLTSTVRRFTARFGRAQVVEP